MKLRTEHKEGISLRIALLIAFAVVLLPFVFWFGYPPLVCWLFGGDALGGKIEGGHFYLGNHGRYREVSRSGYIASACGMAFWALSGLAAAMLALLSDAGREWTGASRERKAGVIMVLLCFTSFAAYITYLTVGHIAMAWKS
jgi:hypothetical protein